MERDLAYERATDWLQRLDHPELREEEIQSWLEWFAASDQNRKAFEEMQTLRRRFRALTPDLRAELSTSFPSPLVGEGPGVRGEKWKLPLALAATLLIVSGATFWWYQTHSTPQRTVYSAPTTHHRTVPLADGSALVLGADSTVAVVYSREHRAFDIQRGEAYFEVRPNPKRPFIVQAGTVRVTALGTAFNVQRKPDQVMVTVTEGKVAVSSALPASGAGKSVVATPQDEVLLTVGQRAVVPFDAPPRLASTAAKPPAPMGDKERAEFIDASLSEVIPFINRHAPAQLVINDPRVADLTYSGTIFRKHIDEWIASLPEVYPIRTVSLEDGSIALVSRETAVQ